MPSDLVSSPTPAYTRADISDLYAGRRLWLTSRSCLVVPGVLRTPSDRISLHTAAYTRADCVYVSRPAYTRAEISDCERAHVLSYAALVERHPAASHNLHLRIRGRTASLCLDLRIRGKNTPTVSAPMFCRARRSSNAIWPRLFAYPCVYAGRICLL